MNKISNNIKPHISSIDDVDDVDDVIEQDTFSPSSSPSKIEQWLLAIACTSFFPLVYLVGSFVKEWLN